MTKLRQILVFLKPFKRQFITALSLTGVLTLVGMAPPRTVDGTPGECSQ
jgi:hypothetical protein